MNVDIPQKSDGMPPIGEQEGKRDAIEAMFDKIAPHYDLLNRVLSLGIDQWWRHRAINCLVQDKPTRVLDVATGTADVAIMAAKKLRPQEVVGIDIADEMLRLGRAKVAAQGQGKYIKLLRADAAQLPFSNDTFDAAVVAYGVRNFEDLGEGLSEIRRVLRPDGKLVVLEFSKPRISPVKELYQIYSWVLLPLIGRLVSGDPAAYTYLPKSVEAFPDGTEFLDYMAHAGYDDLQWKQLTFGISSLYEGRA